MTLLPALLLLSAPAPEPVPVVVESAVPAAVTAEPPVYLEDLQRFPPPWLCDMQIDFFNARLTWLEAVGPLYPESYDYLSLATADAQARKDAWISLRAAQRCASCECLSWEYVTPMSRPNLTYDAHGWLRELRREIGSEAYRAGWMPSAVGLAFQRAGD